MKALWKNLENLDGFAYILGVASFVSLWGAIVNGP